MTDYRIFVYICIHNFVNQVACYVRGCRGVCEEGIASDRYDNHLIYFYGGIKNAYVLTKSRWSKVKNRGMPLGQEMYFSREISLHVVKSFRNIWGSMYNYVVVVFEIIPNLRLVLAHPVSMIINITRAEENRIFRTCFVENCLDCSLYQ